MGIQTVFKTVNKIDDKLVVITGGTSGLGLEIALACLEKNSTVVLLSRKEIDCSKHSQLRKYPNKVYSLSQLINCLVYHLPGGEIFMSQITGQSRTWVRTHY